MTSSSTIQLSANYTKNNITSSSKPTTDCADASNSARSSTYIRTATTSGNTVISAGAENGGVGMNTMTEAQRGTLS